MKNIIKILFIFILLFLLGCDFRIPQKWETPEWQFDLTIPLIDEEYHMSSIASDSNDIQITPPPDTTDFIVSVNENIIEPGTIVTDESFFIIEGSEIDVPFLSIDLQNPDPMPEIPSISESITLNDLLADLDFTIQAGDCIPKRPVGFEDIETSVPISIPSFCDDIGQVECLEQINFLTIESGQNNFQVNNQLPFKIDQLDLDINSDEGAFISISLPSNNNPEIDGLINVNDLLDDSDIGCNVDGSLYFKVNVPLQTSSSSEDCNICEESEFNGESGEWINNDCYIPLTLGQETCSEIEYNGNNGQWIDNECYIEITLTQETCEQIEYNGQNGQWIDNECYIEITLTQEICEQIEVNGQNGQWIDNECRLIADNVLDFFSCDYIGLTWDNNLSQCYELIEINSTSCQENGWQWLNDQNSCYQLIELNTTSCEENGWQWFDDQNSCYQLIELNTTSCEENGWQWLDDQNGCYQLIESISTTCEEYGGQWLNNQNGCYIPCTQVEDCCELVGFWENGQCVSPSFDGFKVEDPNASLTIQNEIILNSFESLNADIACSIDTTYSISLPANPGMNLVEGHISDLEHLDTNRVNLNLTNNLFSSITTFISSDNLINDNGEILGVDGNPATFQTIPSGEDFEDIILSNYTIKNPNGGIVDNLDINFRTDIFQQSATIEFGSNYGIEGTGIEVVTTQLDALTVNFDEFTSPDIDMGSVPSGLDGFSLPFLTFNLYMYNQISAGMKLYLDLYGIREQDTLRIHVEPNITFLDSLNPETDTDNLIISFYEDTMSVQHINENINVPAVKTPMDNKITDLFAYDKINISGYAVMDGDATLLPNKSLWGDLEVIINPLTIVIEDSEKFGFISRDFTEFSVMDPDIATKIDSGLISASIDMNLNSRIPFAGNLLMYISNNSTYFPFCIDSLKTGLLSNQEVSDSCKNYINNYLGCDNLSILEIYPDTDSSFVKHLDCIANNDNYYYENLLNLKFVSPNLDEWGNVLDSVSTQQKFILDDEIYYFTRDNLQYLIPRFIFNSELDTITLQPDNSLKINSSIVFKLLTTGLLEQEE